MFVLRFVGESFLAREVFEALLGLIVILIEDSQVGIGEGKDLMEVWVGKQRVEPVEPEGEPRHRVAVPLLQDGHVKVLALFQVVLDVVDRDRLDH